MAILKRAFSLGVKNDPPLLNRLIYVPTLAENNVRAGFLNHDNYIKLRNELPEAVRPLFVVGYHIVARLGELLSLRWPEVDLKAGRITLDPGTTKNDEGRTLPIYGEMASWRSACKRAGVPGLLFHDLRRTAVRNMIRAGISEKIAMKISGHKSRSVFDRYDIVNERDLVEAAAKLENYLGKNVGTILGTISTSEPEASSEQESKLLN